MIRFLELSRFKCPLNPSDVHYSVANPCPDVGLCPNECKPWLLYTYISLLSIINVHLCQPEKKKSSAYTFFRLLSIKFGDSIIYTCSHFP